MAQTLVFGWLALGDATLEELAQTAAVLHVEISPQGLDQRFTHKTADFLLDLLKASVNEVVATQPVAIEILQRFNGVYLIDSSVIHLPDELAEVWSGCGGSSERNTASAVKLQVGLELATGLLIGPELGHGRTQDKGSMLQHQSRPKRFTENRRFRLLQPFSTFSDGSTRRLLAHSTARESPSFLTQREPGGNSWSC